MFWKEETKKEYKKGSCFFGCKMKTQSKFYEKKKAYKLQIDNNIISLKPLLIIKQNNNIKKLETDNDQVASKIKIISPWPKKWANSTIYWSQHVILLNLSKNWHARIKFVSDDLRQVP